MNQVILKWDSHVGNLLSVMEDLRAADSFVDVTIACEGHFINAHKLVLSAGSEFFHQMFHKKPAVHPTVVLQDIKYTTLELIIDFLYRGETTVDQSQLEVLAKASNTLSIKGLKDICNDLLLLYNDENSSPNANSNESKSPYSSPLKKKQRTQSFVPQGQTLAPKNEGSSLFCNSVESSLRILDAQSLNLSVVSSALPSNDSSVCVPPRKQKINSKDSLTEVEVQVLNIGNTDPIPEEVGSDAGTMNGHDRIETVAGSPSFGIQQRLPSVEKKREKGNAERRKILQLLHQVIQTQEKHSDYLQQLPASDRGSGFRSFRFKPSGLPAKTTKEFAKWDSSLETSGPMFEHAVEYFSSKCGHNIKQSVRRVMRQAMTYEVASGLNWAGRGGKMAFKTTRFLDIVIGIYHHVPSAQENTPRDFRSSLVCFPSDSKIVELFRKSQNPIQFSVCIARLLFTPEEMRLSNCRGVKDKYPLDKERLQFIYSSVMKYFDVSPPYQSTIWKQCVLGIDTRCRHERRLSFKNSMTSLNISDVK